MGCFSSSQPTYSPPAPPTLQTASQLYGDAQNFWNTNYPSLAGAQTNALNNANDPNYYSKWQPTSFEQALGSQYFNNVWPDTQAFMKNQLAQSGMINTPGASEALGKEYGNLSTGIGQYLSDQANSRATNALNAGLGISVSSLLNPFVQTGQQQSNNQANLNYGYSQAQAQQQYQQQMNQYQQQQSLAQALGYISPVAGNIYNATQGNLGSGLQGSFNSVQQMMPLMMMGAGGGFGNIFGGGGGTSNLSGSLGNGMTNNGVSLSSSLSDGTQPVFANYKIS